MKPALSTNVKNGDQGHATLHNDERQRLNWLTATTEQLYNIADYGAVGDGLTDDTVAMTNALTAAIENGGTVVIPAGTYRITDTITALQNSGGVVIRGYGMPGHYRPATKLLWDGPADGRAMLDISGTGYIHIEDIGLFANSSAAGTSSNVVGIKAIGNPAYWGSFFNSCRRLYFQNFAVAIDIGSASDQVDTWTIDKCWFVYDTADGIGLRVNSTNALVIQLTHCTLTGAGQSPMASSSGVLLNTGSVKMFGCVTARNKYGIHIAAQPTGTSGIFGHHSEGDGCAVYTASVSGNGQKANSLTISDLYVYNSQDAMLSFNNENMQYSVTGAYAQKATGDDKIIVPDSGDVWLWNVTSSNGVTCADGSPAQVYGSYGAQGPAARELLLPTAEFDSIVLKSPDGSRWSVNIANDGTLQTQPL